MTAAVLVAVIDDINRFDDAQSFASYLGLVPSESSSADKRRMGTITRSGSEILRRYLIHGARSVIVSCERYKVKVITDHNKLWALKTIKRIGMNKTCVALAHQVSRVAFAMLRDESVYESKVPTQEQLNKYQEELAKAC